LTWCIPCLTIVKGDINSIASEKASSSTILPTSSIISPSSLSSSGCQRKTVTPVQVKVNPAASATFPSQPCLFTYRRASLHSIPICPTNYTVKSNHQSSLFGKVSVTNYSNTALRPCLRHRRNLSHSCDDLLNSSRKVAEAVAAHCNTLGSKTKVNLSGASSVCNGSVKSVKFLLPDKKSVTMNDHIHRRFSIGSLMPGAFANYTWTGRIPNFAKNQLGFQGTPFFSPNIERFLWSKNYCPCYHCQVPFTYASYNTGHWEYSLATDKHRQLTFSPSTTNQVSSTIQYRRVPFINEG